MKRCFSIDRFIDSLIGFQQNFACSLFSSSFFLQQNFSFCRIEFDLFFLWFLYSTRSTHEKNIYFSTASLVHSITVPSISHSFDAHHIVFRFCPVFQWIFGLHFFLNFSFYLSDLRAFFMVKISRYYRPYLLPDQLDFLTVFPFNISPDHHPIAIGQG